MCEPLWKDRAWLGTFLEIEGSEPTNNASERALPRMVIWRKLSCGTPSAAGSRFVEMSLTAIETCRQQNRPAIACFSAALADRFTGRPAPLPFAGA